MDNIQGSLDSANVFNHNTVKDISDVNFRQNIIAWEKLARTAPQVDLKVEHHFSYGVYARTVHIPKGIILTGLIHKFENLNILSKGKMRVSIGDRMEVVEAPFIVVSPPNTKRIAEALEDCVWTTIHGTHERDIEIIENYFIAHSEEEYLEFAKQQLPLPGF